jgi:folate-binding protein YgfZ
MQAMELFYVRLMNRGLIHLEGEDRHAFLQNLITNDIRKADSGKALYTALLSAQGKFLYDFFILEGDGFTLLDCEGGIRAQGLFKHLKLYKLRAKVQISMEEQNSVFAVFGQKPDSGTADPRHTDMGWRSFEKPENLPEKPFDVWDERRIRLGIPDGSRDMGPQDTALECNMDKINGVSFDKGCYVGQEITSRMHLRNILKNSLYPVEIKGPVPEPFTDIHINGQLVGQMRSHCGNIGLVMLKHNAIPSLADSPVRIMERVALRTGQ